MGNPIKKVLLCESTADTKKKSQLERQLIGREKNTLFERMSVYANEVREDSLAKVPDDDIEIGEAAAVRFAKFRI